MKDGGSAFPKQPIYKMPHGVELVTEQQGMSLRDYFAAAALPNLVVWDEDGLKPPVDAAILAYEYADAMIAEREKK